MNHTPSPWLYDERPGIVAVYAGERRNCLEMPYDSFLFARSFDRRDGGWTVNEQACADARLIAAAPDLLQALLLAEKHLTRELAYQIEFGLPSVDSEELKQVLNKARAVIRRARAEGPAAWLEKLVVGCRIRMGQTLATITQTSEPGFFYYKTDLGNKGYFDMADWKLPEGHPSCPVEILDETQKEKESHV